MTDYYLLPWAFPLLLYVVLPTIAGVFLTLNRNENGDKKNWKSIFSYYFFYSFIGAIISPLLLKTIDNKIFEDIAAPYYKYYLLGSYMMLVTLFASPLIKKISAATFGDEIAKEMNLYAKATADLVQNNVEQGLPSVDSKQSFDLHALLDSIMSGKIKTTNDASNNQLVLDLALQKRLIKIDKSDLESFIKVTSLGKVYALSKQ
jgi:hypothetical protein